MMTCRTKRKVKKPEAESDGGAHVYRRLTLADGTSWPHPDNYCGRGGIGQEAYIGRLRELTAAYCDLLTHPWGTGASVGKLRMLRRELT